MEININISEQDRILGKVCNWALLIITCILLVHGIFYIYHNISPHKYLIAIGIVVNIIGIAVTYRLDYSSVKKLIPIYLFFVSLYLYPFVYLFLEMGQVTALIWYLVIQLSTILFFSMRSVIFWFIYIFLLITSVYILSTITSFEFDVKMMPMQVSMINFLTIISCFILICFFLYYINKVNQIRTKEQPNSSGMEETDGLLKYESVYNNILECIEKEEPFRDPDFSISQLSYMINTNVTYISKAIKVYVNMNFNTFINTYRINMVKKMLNDDFQNRYTLRYIYTFAGFRHQPTFNKVFKQIEGITPSEYIRNIRKEDFISD